MIHFNHPTCSDTVLYQRDRSRLWEYRVRSRASVLAKGYGVEKFGVKIKMACSGLLRTFYLCHGVHLLFILQLSNSCDSE